MPRNLNITFDGVNTGVNVENIAFYELRKEIKSEFGDLKKSSPADLELFKPDGEQVTKMFASRKLFQRTR